MDNDEEPFDEPSSKVLPSTGGGGSPPGGGSERPPAPSVGPEAPMPVQGVAAAQSVSNPIPEKASTTMTGTAQQQAVAVPQEDVCAIAIDKSASDVPRVSSASEPKHPEPEASEQITAATAFAEHASTATSPPPRTATDSHAAATADEPKEEDDEDGEIRYTDDDIQKDAANIAVMAVVNVALIFFAGLFLCAVAGSILLMGQFGFVTFTIVLCLVAIVVGTGMWVLQVVDQDRKLRPVKRKMERWQAIAKAVVINEIENFKLDWQEHLMLTNGGEGDDYEDYQEMGDGDDGDGDE